MVGLVATPSLLYTLLRHMAAHDTVQSWSNPGIDSGAAFTARGPRIQPEVQKAFEAGRGNSYMDNGFKTTGRLLVQSLEQYTCSLCRLPACTHAVGHQTRATASPTLAKNQP